jgi:hypothetical protein
MQEMEETRGKGGAKSAEKLADGSHQEADCDSPRSDISTTSGSAGEELTSKPMLSSSDGEQQVSSTPGQAAGEGSSDDEVPVVTCKRQHAGADEQDTERRQEVTMRKLSLAASGVRDFYIFVNKVKDLRLGLDVQDTDGLSLLIRSVHIEGLVHKWNQENPSLEVCAGDHIVTINGLSRDAPNMLRECRRSQVLKLRVIATADPDALKAIVNKLRVSRGPCSGKVSNRSVAADVANGSARSPVEGSTVVVSAEPPTSKAGNVSGSGDRMDGLPPAQKSQRAAKKDAKVCFSAHPTENKAAISLALLVPSADASTITPKADDSTGTNYVEGGKTRLSRHANAFTPSFNIPEPAFSPNFGGAVAHGEVIVAKSGSCGEISSVLQESAAALSFCTDAQGVQVVEGQMGTSTKIIIELSPSGSVAAAAWSAKQALLEATAKSRSTYVVGYTKEPFIDDVDGSFSTLLASMPHEETACWDFYKNGCCERPSSCCRSHPTSKDMLVVRVSFRQCLKVPSMNGFHY